MNISNSPQLPITADNASVVALDRAAGGHQETMAVAGGAFDGAARDSLELDNWFPSISSANGDILPEKDLLDARGRDVWRSDPHVAAAMEVFKTSVVGTRMILNAKPDAALLGPDFTEEVLDKVQAEIESLFYVYAESPAKHVDASGKRTLTDIVRLACMNFIIEGEFLATLEWRPGQKFGTKVQVVDIARLSNPDGQMDYRTENRQLIRGIEYDADMNPLAYHIQTRHPSDLWAGGAGERKWSRVPARKPWGRPMVLHVYEHLRAEQSRGIGRIVSALKTLRMTKKFSEVALRNATVKATFAAVIESAESPFTVYQQLGMSGPSAGQGMDAKAVGQGVKDVAAAYLNAANAYTKTGNVAKLDGVRIPHLMPGTKLNLVAPTNGDLGTDFEKSLLRRVAASLGLSYEEMTKDMDGASYAAMKAAMSMTYQTAKLIKALVADEVATDVYMVWLEEAVERGMIKSLPASARRPGWIREGFNLEGLSRCSWIGAARNSVNEYQDMQAAKMRLDLGVSTMEDECGLLNKDYRDVIRQQAREAKEYRKYGMIPPEHARRMPTPEQRAADTEDRLAAVEASLEEARIGG